MKIATCPRCNNVGAVDGRYCDCPAAAALRARIDNDPGIQELRAKIEQNLGEREPSIMVRVESGAMVHHKFAAKPGRAVN